MTLGNRRRLVLSSVFALASAALLGLTLARPDWLELLTGVDPDRHNGSFEWMLVAVCAAAALVASLDVARGLRIAWPDRPSSSARPNGSPS